MTPVLNWRELSALVDLLRPEIEGMFVERIIIPERPKFPEKYIKNEFAIRLTGKRQEKTLLISLRPRHPYIALCEGKGPRSATQATLSPFFLALSKTLRSAKILKLEALSHERVAILWFEGEEKLGLVLSFIPATPEGFLIQQGWKILTHSRVSNKKAPLEVYTPPDGSKAPADPPLREELIQSPFYYTQLIEKELESEAFELQLKSTERLIKENLKQAQDRIKQSETAILEASREPNWAYYGDLLKSSLGKILPPEKGSKTIYILDYSTGEKVEIPWDPKLSPPKQVEKFYQLAKRRARKIEEAQTRLEDFQKLIQELKESPKLLDQKEGKAPIGGRKAATAWLGKSFTSIDGLPIWVGRNRKENLELTFKHARGNDVWMHIRGRPGAHVLISLPAGKSAPLETLLDAAVLAIYYSGGEKWGKTEVDYTFKKYVKRIKDSDEASYTHNRTLLVEPKPERLKRLI